MADKSTDDKTDIDDELLDSFENADTTRASRATARRPARCARNRARQRRKLQSVEWPRKEPATSPCPTSTKMVRNGGITQNEKYTGRPKKLKRKESRTGRSNAMGGLSESLRRHEDRACPARLRRC